MSAIRRPVTAVPGTGGERSPTAVRAIGAPLAAYVSADAVRELLARAQARLPRDRQASDVARRAALGTACAVAETATDAELTAGRPLWTVEVPEDVRDLGERAGLGARDVRDGLALLTDTGVLERVVGRMGSRLRLAEEVLRPAAVLPRVAWRPLREALHTHRVSVAPALAVAYTVATLTGGLRPDGASDPVALTQQDLVEATLFGRTAVVAALRGLVEVGALELAARRGTWTECRLRPAVFEGVGYALHQHLDRVPREPSGAEPAVSGLAEPWHGPQSARPEPGELRTGPPLVADRDASVPPLPVADPGMWLDVGGIAVPLQPGMSVQPPPGAQLGVEIDADGRRYLRIDPSIRLGPLK